MWNPQMGGVHVGLNSGGAKRLGERRFINLALYGHTILGLCQPQGGKNYLAGCYIQMAHLHSSLAYIGYVIFTLPPFIPLALDFYFLALLFLCTYSGLDVS